MPETTDVFHAGISATDEGASKTIESVAGKFRHLASEADHVGHATEHMHKPHVWMALGEHVNLAKEHFGELHASVGEVGASITELLPALAALGAAGTVASLFETAEHVAESYATLSHTASSLGVGTQQLHDLNLVARLTDTSVEGMDKSISKLNKTLGETVAGKNKDAAALFAHLHINPRQFKDGADALPVLADAFRHTSDATVRARMAMVLFGKAGVDMIPLLRMGSEHIKELQGEAARLGFNFEPHAEDLEAYNDSMKKLGISTEAFTDDLGAKLAPVLRPVVDMATEWVVANRDWIATGIVAKVEELSGWVEAIPIKTITDDFKTAGRYAGEFIGVVGGGERAVEILAGLMALKGVLFLAEPIIQVGKLSVAVIGFSAELTRTLARAWLNVGAAADVAAAKETAALNVPAGRGAAIGAGAAAGAEIAAVEGASGGRFAALDRLHNNLRNGYDSSRFSPAETVGLRNRSVGLGLNTLFAAMSAENGVDISQEIVREHPFLAKNLTRAQFEALPANTIHSLPFVGDIDDPAHPSAFARGYESVFGANPYRSAAHDNDLPFKVESESKVTVEFTNAPPGTTATTSVIRGNTVIDADLAGTAFADHYGARR